MEDVQQTLVNDHIGELLREADAGRMEREVRRWNGDGDGAGSSPRGDPRRARVRLGRWLIGLGTAVAGAGGDPQGGAAGHPI